MRAQDELTAFDRAFALAAQLGEMMGKALAERGLNTARAEVLYVLHNQGAQVQRQLAQALDCTPRHVTTLIDTLEAADLVHRTPHPTDRRATLVALTRAGQRFADELDTRRREAAHAILGDTPAADLRAFISVADTILTRIGTSSGT